MVQQANGRYLTQDIPDIVIRRLPIYVRTLERLLGSGYETVSSDDLADQIGVTAAQIRRDLSYFGKFGKQGKGYEVATLINEIRHILNLDREWNVALCGYGHLGQAIAAYRGFELSSFRISEVFDRDPARVGLLVSPGVVVRSDQEIANVVRRAGIRMGIVAVPVPAAQEVADALIEGGVTAILNYAPVILKTPAGVWTREIDPLSAMQSMTYYLDLGSPEPAPDEDIAPAPAEAAGGI